jgi:pimeloyl-ACP methyl ester carboxylesterase
MKYLVTILSLHLALFAGEWQPMEFEAKDGTRVPAELGTIEVPENRANPDSRTISLSFVRFKSTNPHPGPPIVYLAGGPGGSGIATAKYGRFPLFMALREVADVIAFDQRGTGKSNDLPPCIHSTKYPIEQPMTLENAVAYNRDRYQECRDFWVEKGIDLNGYNTMESAADLNDLREFLGAEKISLWGISYGTHLAFAATRLMGDHIHRMVLASSEGPDHTVKLPGWSDAFFHRVGQLVMADPDAAARYGDVVATVRRVMDRLDREPVKVTLPVPGFDEPQTLAITSSAVAIYTSFNLVKDPRNVAQLPAAFAAMDSGDFNQIAGFWAMALYGRPGRSDAMSLAMDTASGISPNRLRIYESQAPTSLLRGMLNYPFPTTFGNFEVKDLGEAFRGPLKTDIPTLFLNGTLDGRTFPEATWVLMRGFENGIQVIVENGGHNLFMIHPEVGKTVVAFFKGHSPQKTLIHVPPPKFK